MEIGIGIPNCVRGTTGAQLLEWARRADSAGFTTLGSIGAVSYPAYEELTTFAAAAAVTERIRLMPNVLIGPARSTAELAKEAATVQAISGGRLTLGLGVGWRESDYLLTGRDFHDRGQRFDQQLADLERAWTGEAIMDDTRPVVPDGAPPVPLIIGGSSDAAVRRAVEHGLGWTAGGSPPEQAREFGDRVRAAWAEAGRDGEPKIVALAYFSLGDVEQASRAYLLDYYSPFGDQVAEMIAGSALRTPEAVHDAIAAFADAGVDELVLNPTVSDPDQVNQLAEVAL